MGAFSGLSRASSSKSLYFVPGSYIVKINKCVLKANRKGIDNYIIETEVLESDTKEIPVGSNPAQIIPMTKDLALSNIKQFLGCMMGIPDVDSFQPDNGQSVDQFWEEAGETSVASSQPLEGYVAELVCHNKKLKNGGDFTVHVWKQRRTDLEAEAA